VKVFLHTFGCRANQYDTEQVRGMLVGGGATIVDAVDEADVALLNSCAVTSDAVADLRQQVRRVARRAPGVRTVVMGCAASLDDGVIAGLPSVTDVVPGADLPRIAALLELPVPIERPAHQTGARALLRIQDGCAEHCTFCATTVARGDHRSRPADDLVREARALAGHHPEIVVTGIHIGHWGREHGSSLGALMQRLMREVPTVRFRLSSVEATEVDAALQECFDERARVAPHLHAPLQSGSDRVLKRMGRHWYTADSYRAAIDALVGGRPTFALGADLITGFPGETDADHAATVALVDALPFSYLHVFPWSPRPGTAALNLGDHVPTDVSHARAAELRQLGVDKARAYARTRAGGVADVVLVRGAGQQGLTEDYLTVRVTGAPRGRGERFAATVDLLEDGSLQATPIAP
jgi:threonylcarbamoyladenosine tRNA methylthiotransferase MtaB